MSALSLIQSERAAERISTWAAERTWQRQEFLDLCNGVGVYAPMEVSCGC